ncbi:hypothetical protein MASR2M39_31120 [Ignavibacteriales bacterium]
MKTKISLSGLIMVVLVFTGCENFKFKDKEAFSNAKEEVKFGTITKVLEDSGIVQDNKFVLRYLDFMLTKSKRLSKLEAIYPTTNYEVFFKTVVPILYHYYSPETFKKANTEMKERVLDYYIAMQPCPVEIHQKQYKQFVKELFADGREYVFDYYDKKNVEESAEGKFDAEDFQWFYYHKMWLTGKLKIMDFKQMNPIDQAELLSYNWKFNARDNGTFDDDTRDLVEKLMKLWKNSNTQIVNSSMYKGLNDFATLGESNRDILNYLLAL